MYRGHLRNQFVRVLRMVNTFDGIGGATSDYVLHDPHYWCRVWRRPVERDRTDQANVEETPWGILGNELDLREGDKIILGDGREFIMTRVWDDGAERGKRHLEGTMHLIRP